MKSFRARVGAAACVAALGAPAAAPAQDTIQPGSSITMGGSYCTLNWIYDGQGAQAGKTYGGTAAHCVSGVGQQVSLSTTSLGTALFPIGKVAFVGPSMDYAFIEIDAAVLSKVSPALKGHPQFPTGVAANPQEGDLIQFSGHGVGSHLTQPTQEQRVGVLNIADCEHQVIGLVTPGDSGGPVGDITNGNTALGIVNTLGAGVNSGALVPVFAGEGGLNLNCILPDAAANGFSVTLRTV